MNDDITLKTGDGIPPEAIKNADRPMIIMPQLCDKHQYLLVTQAGYKETDAWRALIIVAQIALVQGTTADPKTHELIGGDITRITELGCLACYRPDLFGEIVEAAKSHDIGDLKALGEKWIEQGRKDKPGSQNGDDTDQA